MEKLAFISYSVSGIMLAYIGFLFSPFRIDDDAWENSSIPLYFYGIVLTLIFHFLYTGKMLSLEKYKKVLWLSGIIAVGSAFFMLPQIMLFIRY